MSGYAAPNMKKIAGIVTIFLLIVFSSSCLTNIANCPEDTLKTDRCPTEKEKEDREFLILLLLLRNNGNVPPGQVRI